MTAPPFFFQVTVPGEPVAQGRGKVGRWKSKDGREGVTVRDPAKSRNWKAFAMDRFEQALATAGHQVPLAAADEPVQLLITATFACPKGEHRRVPVPARPHTKRGDGDNIWKAVADAGTGVLWHDDAQIFDGRVVKRIGAQGEVARVEIEVRLPYRSALPVDALPSLQRSLLDAGAE